MLGKKIIALAAAGLAAAGANIQMVSLTGTEQVARTNRERHVARNLFSSPWNYSNGPGWTAAHVKRMAKKQRNRARHKTNCKRKGGA